jgi:putative ABC transport system ATP-binding protein
MTETLVRATSLGREFGTSRDRVRAVTGATFSLEPGDTVAVIGPSGSGKSTLLHLMAGLDTPTEGSIVWPALGARGTLRPGSVAMSFQGPSLLPALTVLENVMLPVILAGTSQDAAITGARDMLRAFSVEDLADRLPESLSGGQLQRAGLARAFSGHPRLVLVDEPTGQQDRDSAKRVVDAILMLAARHGTALVVATHDAVMANTLDARWEMRDGSLRTGELAWS